MSPLRTVVVAGASGYVGRHLTGTLDASGIRVRTIGRGPVGRLVGRLGLLRACGHSQRGRRGDRQNCVL